jgi:hypothetical protein
VYQIVLLYGDHFLVEIDLQQKGAFIGIVNPFEMGYLVPLVVGISSESLSELRPHENESVLGVVTQSVELARLELVLGGPKNQVKRFRVV